MRLNNSRSSNDANVRMVGYEEHDGPGAWICYFWFVGWDCISLGLHVSRHNFEIHLPLGFIRIGKRAPAAKVNPFIWRRQ